MNRLLSRTALLLAAVLPLAGCDTFGSSNTDFLREQLARAEEVWAAQGSPDYTLTLTRYCDCPVEPRQVALEVVGDEIVGAIYTDVGDPVDSSMWGQYATVTVLFDLVRDAVNRRVPALIVEYDAVYGYVDNLVINYDRTRVDDDVLFTVEGYSAADDQT